MSPSEIGSDARTSGSSVRERLERAWDECAWALGIRASRGALDELLARWSGPGRYYHDLSHLDACLRVLDSVRAEAARPGEVLAALFFHDAIYDPRATDNEARSAALAREVLTGAPLDAIERVAAAIEATRTHEGVGDVALVIDVDLSILGAEPEAYDAFERAIRAEYAFVEDAAFRAGRAHVLARFASRRPLYRSPTLRAELEVRAHENLARAIEALEGSGAEHR